MQTQSELNQTVYYANLGLLAVKLNRVLLQAELISNFTDDPRWPDEYNRVVDTVDDLNKRLELDKTHWMPRS